MTSPKIQVHLISCLMVTHSHAILIYTIRADDVRADHQFRSAHIEWTGHHWTYRTIADMGHSFYLPPQATSADELIEQTFTSAVDEAIKIARTLGTLT